MKKLAFNLLRFGVSIGLLVYLVYLADVDKIVLALRQADEVWLTLALAIFVVSVFLFTVRWQLLLKGVGISVPYGSLMRYYLIGYFFNNFLPTTIGGDVSRAYNLALHTDQKSDSIASVLMERILGLLATLSLAAVALLLVLNRFSSSMRFAIATVVLMMLIGALMFFLALLHPYFYSHACKLFSRISIMGIGGKIVQLLESIHAYRNSVKTVIAGFLLSLACQLLLVWMNYVLALSLGLDVDFSYLMLVVPVTFAIGLLPSINGLGVRDLGYETLLTRVGVTSAEALSLSFLNTIIPLSAGVAGGICLLFQRKNEKKQQAGVN
ncbi:MAG: lysylphosphatidylglycerol synthase transmembrane domain-containing protein [Calditrichia bacterium]